MRILLVEDNEMNRDMLSRRLIKRGHEILVALDGEQGLVRARAEKPDLILMDISLPGINGLEVTRTLKGEPESAKIPIIALTAHALKSDIEIARAAGCDEFEAKPIDFPKLLAKIDAVTSKRNT